ncbi:MAG: flagellar hook-length control protein FliK [Desulfobacteraceae bacterium]|nr:flagellar hook-length control protein FliK [Desulfobacteraceae bacterium]
MNINTDIRQQVFNLLSKASGLSIVSADQGVDARSGTTLVPGQRVRAEVLTTLANNSAQVQIGTERFNLELPMAVRPGQNLDLTFVTATPRPTFALVPGAAGQSAAAVSDTGRWLSDFLAAAAGKEDTQGCLGILRALLDELPADPVRAGEMLRQGLRGSGLFYESHLARWFAGDYPLEELLNEPQGQLSPRNGLNLPQDGIADPRTLSVVQEQLAALQAGQVLYRGELFPGQQLEWSVSEREARREGDDDRERSWDTTLQLDMPRLGAISARLKLDGNRVSVDIRTGENDSLAVLNTGLPRLVEQLQQAGLTPAEIGIRHDPPQ